MSRCSTAISRAPISDTTHQAGAAQPALQTYWISILRRVLDVEMQEGKAHAAKHSMPRLRQLLERLAPEERPVLMRGDSAFGNKSVMTEIKEIEQP